MDLDQFKIVNDTCGNIAEQFRDTVKNFRFSWQDKIFYLGISISLVSITSGARDIVSILSLADMACYAAKKCGRNRVHVYSESDKELLKRHKEMHSAAAIKQAIEDNQFIITERTKY
ncbi:diguanylate cyclase/phosphodiesterase (GGDEF & EAL domains) with PAS/PAC sensor(s) [hydrothermal vent metagenome]|uniref:Diguanylate cyclase/phosphodiesterase (GGDEF & EAL domains) with PAS/PAC sensor(S) n=1 Tax=hydrothermal vent metagenome TaxID=652676 RepID=A0A3B1AFU8_9ZZZZ